LCETCGGEYRASKRDDGVQSDHRLMIGRF
jgi:hypothetical protein